MSELGICKSLAGGGSLLASKEGSGWQPVEEVEREEHPVRDPNPVSCREQKDPDKEGGCQKPGQLAKAKPQQEGDWKELGKKRHRRLPSKNKRKWKPYCKLTWEEKKNLEERASQRASRIRAEMIAKGQPVAPYNTTQFLMEDHDQEEPDLCPPPRKSSTALPLAIINSSYKGDSTDDDLEEEEDETGSDGMGVYDGEDFLQKDFSETYERYHAESLQDMSKQELIREYMELEKCLSRMEEENNRLRLQSLTSTPVADHKDSRIQELQLELEKLKEENQRLLQERKQVASDSCEH
ncbi:hypothetical protein XENTR_v10003811 [Xenopus tropicalis]|uniref:Hexamethylene bis-acetamide inducible 1 n=1 Tax=Xenopus tropicalis TaxID=8364 RepID=A0A803KC67_XENTR|nr:protein HEXIM1 [Xenopus tropicalis]KAE8575374.1 hypothetical protein XENTR_v10003811 [Xenopus tropicalis]